MAESHKEAASSSKPQKKTSLLDEEIGTDFFSSWKSMSTTKDDGLDFSGATVPKGKKNTTFNFDNLDMDFSLDGDFGKNLSSFKVDMSDLDFSSPPKKLAKPKEKSAAECNLRKQEGKKERFTFAFDFDGLDNFDLDSTLMKKEKKSDKPADDKVSNSPEKKGRNQGLERNLVTSIGAPEDDVSFTRKLDKFDLDSSLMQNKNKSDKCPDDKVSDSPGRQEMNQGSRRNYMISNDAPEDGDTNTLSKTECVTTSKVDLLIGSLGKFDSTNSGSLSVSTDVQSLNASHDTSTIPDKEMVSSGKEREVYSEQSQKTVSTEPAAEEIVQDSSVRSVSVDDSLQDIPELQAEVCSSASEVNTNSQGEQGIVLRPNAGLDSNIVISSNMESSPVKCQLESTDKGFCKMLENQTDVPTGNINMEEPVQGDTEIEDASVARAASKLLTGKSTKETLSVPKLLTTPMDSEPKSHILVPAKGKETDSLPSKPLNQSGRTGSQPHTGGISKKVYPTINKKLENVLLSTPGARRQESNISDEQTGSQKFGSSISKNKAVKKDVLSALGNEKDNKNQQGSTRQESNASDAQAGSKLFGSSKLQSKAVTKDAVLGSGKDFKNQKVSASFQVPSASSIGQTNESKTLKGLDSRLLGSSIPSVRNSRSSSVERNKLSPLQSFKAFDCTSLKMSRPVTPKSDQLHTKVQTEIKSLKCSEGNALKHISPAAKIDHSVTVEKQVLLSPSLKRRMIEAPKTCPVTSYPSGSPSENRNIAKITPKVDNKRARTSESPLGSFRFSPTIDGPRNAYLKELEVPLLVENDGIVEKAEACSKELENLCNMLKKKHEEAKEILVRAIVNNNELLMLNHPIYDEKIRMVQRLTSSLLSREIQT